MIKNKKDREKPRKAECEAIQELLWTVLEGIGYTHFNKSSHNITIQIEENDTTPPIIAKETIHGVEVITTIPKNKIIKTTTKEKQRTG